MKSKGWFGAAVCASVVIGVGCVVLTLQFTAQCRNEAVARLREIAAIHQVIPKTDALPDRICDYSVTPVNQSENDARAPYRKLAALVTTLQESNPKGYEACRKFIDNLAVDPHPPDYAEALAFIDQARVLIPDIRRLASLDGPYFDVVNREDGWRDTSALGPLYDFTLLLFADALVQSRRNLISESVSDLISAMRIAETVLPEPCPSWQQLRYVVYRQTFETEQEIARSAEFSVEHARALLAQLPLRDGREALIKSLAYLSLYLVESLEKTRGRNWLDFYRQENLSRYERILLSPVGGPALDLAEQTFVYNMVEVMQAAQLPYYEAKGKLAEFDRATRELPRWRKRGLKFIFDQLPSQHLWNQATYEAMLDLMRLGLLARQYELQFRRCPASLEVIAAETGGATPLDPFSGGDYIFRFSGNSFTLRSVGINGTDDSDTDGVRGDDIAWRGGA